MGSNEKTFAIIALCGIIGIIIAILLQFLYDSDIVISKYIGDTFTLKEIQFACILIWEIFGIGLVAIEK